ncbi:DUF1659 domain-containing protein [Terrisporobacter sp.]|uniref:DUF1659 domain-containing protein n=1 Tax=Terrisporobacter sp. TaxID=1965305 RepID=UPI002623AD33|nr:DUF1659 domain-containing protein [Terrisporobacter sp.]
MAVISNPNASSIKIKFDHGPDLEGNNVYKTKTLSGIKSSATNEDIMAVVKSISGLQKHSLSATNRVDNTSLSE